MLRLTQFFLFISVLLLPITNVAQNLMPNGGFENYWAPPSSTGDYYQCVGWTNINGNVSGSPSPDYFHTLGSFPVQLPDNNDFINYLEPHSGDGLMGLIAFYEGGEYREYISTELGAPLKPGVTYTLSFWLTTGVHDHSISDIGFGMQCDRLGVHFSTTPLTQVAVEPIGVIPQIEIPYEFSSETWEYFSFDFTADSAYTHFSMGNFYPDLQVSASYYDTLFGNSAYYFIDDIELQMSSPPMDFEESINIFTPNNDGDNDFFSIPLPEGAKMTSFSVVNRWGTVVYETSEMEISWDGTSNDRPCKEGSYFWILNYTDHLGNRRGKHGWLTLSR